MSAEVHTGHSPLYKFSSEAQREYVTFTKLKENQQQSKNTLEVFCSKTKQFFLYCFLFLNEMHYSPSQGSVKCKYFSYVVNSFYFIWCHGEILVKMLLLKPQSFCLACILAEPRQLLVWTDLIIYIYFCYFHIHFWKPSMYCTDPWEAVNAHVRTFIHTYK